MADPDPQPVRATGHTETGLARRLGTFDATMIVMGGIVGAGIFMNPSLVAREAGSTAWALAAWALGGLMALAGAFIWAELAALHPATGGQYAYLRDAFHPVVAFLYGWGLLLVIQSGGMAAVAMTFARYARELVEWPLAEGVVAVGVLAVLTVVNCLGVRAGSNVQSVLMVTKIAAITAVVVAGALVPPGPSDVQPVAPRGAVGALLAALVPVLFAYGGWQTSSFVAGELKRPERDLPRALLWGTAGVVALYLAVNVTAGRALGPAGLAGSDAPAADVMRRALGEAGARLTAAAIAVSALGFLSQGMLTAPRVYHAMGRDGVFFRRLGEVDEGTRAPVAAIILQGGVAAVIALSGRYDQVLAYVVSVDFIFFGLTAATLFVFRARRGRPALAVPGHPFTTTLFIAACWTVVAHVVWNRPQDTLVGLGLLAAGVPAFLLWRRAS